MMSTKVVRNLKKCLRYSPGDLSSVFRGMLESYHEKSRLEAAFLGHERPLVRDIDVIGAEPIFRTCGPGLIRSSIRIVELNAFELEAVVGTFICCKRVE